MHHALFLSLRAVLPRRRLERCRALLVAALLVTYPRLVGGATLSGSFAGLSPGTTVDLSGEGQLDWGHWGLVTEWSYNHKYGVARQITYSFVTDAYYTDGPYLLGGGMSVFGWTNGTPTRLSANATNGASIFGDKLPGNTPTGFHLQCPADSTPRRLKVYLATSGAAATFSAGLSGASTYTDGSFIGGTGPANGVYTLDFQADSPGQTLTVDFKSTNTPGYITLQAATLVGTNAPPTAAITGPTDGTSLSAPAAFTLTAAAADSDGTVTNLTLLKSATALGQSASGTFDMPLSNQPAGAYNFLAVATDNSGLSVTSFPVRVSVTTNGGTLVGSVGIPPTNVDLTAEGTSDWAHWGLASPSSFDHKSGVTQQIPNVVLLNASSSDLANYFDSRTAYSWSDGTPTAQAFGSTTGVFLYATNNPPAGFQLTVPATNLLRHLSLYLGLYRAQGRLDAWLSDFSALPYSDSSVLQPDSNTRAVYTLAFASANPGVDLVVTWTPTVVFDALFGNLTWQAATLWERPPQPVLHVGSPPGASPFAFSFHAEVGASYTVLFADTLGSSNWQSLTNFPGTGTDVLVVDPGVGSSVRFYRVLVQ